MKKLFLTFSLLTVVVLAACSQPKTPEPEVTGLKSVSSQAELQNLVKPYLQSGIRGDGFFALNRLGSVADLAPSVGTTEATDAPQDVSSTNVQIEGVDEADIIKTDGNRIYRIDGQRFYVIELLNGQMELIYSETIETLSENGGYSYFSGLYLTDQYVVLVGERYDTYQALESDDANIRILPLFRWGIPFTLIKVMDRASLETVATYEISGSFNTSRLIDDQLYVLATHSIYTLEDDFDPRPVIRTNGVEKTPDYSEIKYIENVATEAFTMMARVDLSSTPELSTDILLGSMGWGQVYVNLEGLYFAETRYFSIRSGVFNTTDTWVQEGRLISYTFDENGALVFGGVGTYKGWIQNQFWMDEYDGFFRLVTTTGWGDDVINRLYVFERQFTEEGPRLTAVAVIDEGLGKPRETVRSVRFQGTLATVVTFEMTDPLYTIDLTDPFNPTIRAGLEITGFATYQHPWLDETLVGIGYETNEDGMIIGLKLTLFDISDWDNPVEIGAPLRLLNGTNGRQYSEALHNHKAILIARNKGFIGFSVNHARWLAETGSFSEDYLIFTIDRSLDTPIQIGARFDHDRFIDASTERWFSLGMERAIYVDDVLYVVSSRGISSHQISADFENISDLVFE